MLRIGLLKEASITNSPWTARLEGAPATTTPLQSAVALLLFSGGSPDDAARALKSDATGIQLCEDMLVDGLCLPILIGI